MYNHLKISSSLRSQIWKVIRFKNESLTLVLNEMLRTSLLRANGQGTEQKQEEFVFGSEFNGGVTQSLRKVMGTAAVT